MFAEDCPNYVCGLRIAPTADTQRITLGSPVNKPDLEIGTVVPLTRRAIKTHNTIMTCPIRLILSLSFLCTFPVLADQSGVGCATAPGSWPQWRGPLANGVAPRANPPIHWNETNNIRWKIPLPGKGHSSPIVLGDSVYVLSAAPVGPAQKPVYDDAPGV